MPMSGHAAAVQTHLCKEMQRFCYTDKHITLELATLTTSSKTIHTAIL